MKKDWTEIVKDKLSESAITPGDELWEGISSQLDAKLAREQTRMKFRLWKRWVAAASVTTTLATVAYFSINRLCTKSTSESLIAQNVNIRQTTLNETSITDVENVSEAKEKIPEESSFEVKSSLNKDSSAENNCTALSPSSGVISNSHPVSNDIQTNQPKQNQKVEENLYAQKEDSQDKAPVKPSLEQETGNCIEQHISDENDTEGNMAQLNTQQNQESSNKSEWENYQELLNNDYNKNSEIYPLLAESSLKTNNALSIKIFTSSVNLTGLHSGIPNKDLFVTGSTRPVDPGDDLTSSDNSEGEDSSKPEEPQSRLFGQAKLKKAKHSLPLRFGFSLRYPLSSFLSLSSGLVYSRLSSTMNWTANLEMPFETNQTLNYLGIPISVDFSIPSFEKVGFYLTLGGMLEKCIYGQSKSSKSTLTEKVRERQFQVSMFAGAGAEFRLNRNFSIYVEPLATYYFNNHSDIINIYKDRKLNFDLRFGMRWNIKR